MEGGITDIMPLFLGMWHYGYYAVIPSDGGKGSLIYENDEWIEVKSETVGQFTGLHDKNGNGEEVWQEDILGEPRVGNEPDVVGIVKRYDDLGAFVVEKQNGGWEYLWKHLSENKNHEVIGNKFETPDLL